MLAKVIMNRLSSAAEYVADDEQLVFKSFIDSYFTITNSSHDTIQIAEIYDKWKLYSAARPSLSKKYRIEQKSKDSKKLFRFLETNYKCRKIKPRISDGKWAVTHMTLKNA